jgi:predicted HTH transcriptional regulator
LIEENNEVTTEVLTNKVGISIRAVEKHLKKLRDKKEIERIGADKVGYWFISYTHHNSWCTGRVCCSINSTNKRMSIPIS